MPVNLAANGEPERIWGRLAAVNFLEVAGVSPILGRGFMPGEDKVPGQNAVVLLGNGLWRRRFGADAKVIGRRVLISGRTCTVIGVLPQGFNGIFGGVVGDFWVPLSMAREIMPDLARNNISTNRGSQWLIVDARLGDGVTRERAAATVNVALRATRPDLVSALKDSGGPSG